MIRLARYCCFFCTPQTLQIARIIPIVDQGNSILIYNPSVELHATESRADESFDEESDGSYVPLFSKEIEAEIRKIEEEERQKNANSGNENLANVDNLELPHSLLDGAVRLDRTPTPRSEQYYTPRAPIIQNESEDDNEDGYDDDDDGSCFSVHSYQH
jgi:hypothetical protein